MFAHEAIIHRYQRYITYVLSLRMGNWLRVYNMSEKNTLSSYVRSPRVSYTCIIDTGQNGPRSTRTKKSFDAFIHVNFYRSFIFEWVLWRMISILTTNENVVST